MTEKEVVTPEWFYQGSTVFKHLDALLNFGNDERRKLPSAERKKEKEENSPGEYKAGLPQAICGVELKKG